MKVLTPKDLINIAHEIVKYRGFYLVDVNFKRPRPRIYTWSVLINQAHYGIIETEFRKCPLTEKYCFEIDKIDLVIEWHEEGQLHLVIYDFNDNLSVINANMITPPKLDIEIEDDDEVGEYLTRLPRKFELKLIDR